MIVFGPVPSRRLGRSLGVNNIPYKICTYNCIYCQVGNTVELSIERRGFYSPDEIFKEVVKRRAEMDYITFVPDGEPTLDINIGKSIDMLRKIGKIAVITNSSLLWREDVRRDLMKADVVSLKIDAITPYIWKKINKPHPKLDIHEIIDGMVEFSRDYKGKIITETMLIGGIDYGEELNKIADILKIIKPEKAYISIPTRPPRVPHVRGADEKVLVNAHAIFSKVVKTEYLLEEEGNEFYASGDLEKDIISITSVHPMRKRAVERLLERNGKSWEAVEKLIMEKKIVEVEYEGEKFYMRKMRQ